MTLGTLFNFRNEFQHFLSFQFACLMSNSRFAEER